ncbi:hypothetical protein EXW62_28160 (plasmid) [Bacillus mycoides]|uniref:hypothetical protein n=1 Tax=Bacillus mycoides TaxID=1405 RepID=UPI001C03119E|nr:hypothetical protein [Bacillus mycoides]QWH20844.1 hypothetical protein EXW62_28160 [Bacillus mycoides]
MKIKKIFSIIAMSIIFSCFSLSTNISSADTPKNITPQTYAIDTPTVWRPTHILTKIYSKQISTKNEPDFLL